MNPKRRKTESSVSAPTPPSLPPNNPTTTTTTTTAEPRTSPLPSPNLDSLLAFPTISPSLRAALEAILVSKTHKLEARTKALQKEHETLLSRKLEQITQRSSRKFDAIVVRVSEQTDGELERVKERLLKEKNGCLDREENRIEFAKDGMGGDMWWGFAQQAKAIDRGWARYNEGVRRAEDELFEREDGICEREFERSEREREREGGEAREGERRLLEGDLRKLREEVDEWAQGEVEKAIREHGEIESESEFEAEEVPHQLEEHHEGDRRETGRKRKAVD